MYEEDQGVDTAMLERAPADHPDPAREKETIRLSQNHENETEQWETPDPEGIERAEISAFFFSSPKIKKEELFTCSSQSYMVLRRNGR